MTDGEPCFLKLRCQMPESILVRKLDKDMSRCFLLEVNKRGVGEPLASRSKSPSLPEMASQNRQVEEEESGTITGGREENTGGAAESFSLCSFLKPCQRRAAQL